MFPLFDICANRVSPFIIIIPAYGTTGLQIGRVGRVGRVTFPFRRRLREVPKYPTNHHCSWPTSVKLLIGATYIGMPVHSPIITNRTPFMLCMDYRIMTTPVASAAVSCPGASPF